MSNDFQEEINWKKLAKKVFQIISNKRRLFIVLFSGIMLLCAAYYLKVLLKPIYKAEVVIESRFVRKDQVEKYVEYYNTAIENKGGITANIDRIINASNIIKLEVNEIKLDVLSKDKDDPNKLFKLLVYFSEKPKNLENIDFIIGSFKENAANENDINIIKENIDLSISEIDSLLKTAIQAGNNFKNNLSHSSSLIVMNDMYKSLNEILARKSDLLIQRKFLETSNILYKASPVVISKKISMPLIIFFYGLLLWFFISVLYIMFRFNFVDETA